jgi:hypothetical protein
MDFLLDKDSQICPALQHDFFKNFSEDKICKRIEYEWHDLKTYAVLIRTNSSLPIKKLTVYNHGHSGFPAKEEVFALDLINKLLEFEHSICNYWCQPYPQLNHIQI